MRDTYRDREVSSPEVFFDRRRFLSSLGLGLLAGSSIRCARGPRRIPDELLEPPFERPELFPASRAVRYELPSSITRKKLTPREVAGSHNNFYEFLAGQGGPVGRHVARFEVEPWKVEVSGECHHPATFDLDDLFAFDHEERVYHFRCVERWAMNVPWSGFELRKLLEKVEPKSGAQYVRFTSAYVPDQMPGTRTTWYPWPYQEALTLAEAMNELVLVGTGVYGRPLLKQHGAPVRIVVPWKYGYKNPKSIVHIELLEQRPRTFWQIQPHEYGFISNVNPNIPHPRWSQEHSFWLDGGGRFPTPLFNGYEEHVAHLYPDEPRHPQPPLGPNEVAR